jgi:hypothetical protein
MDPIALDSTMDSTMDNSMVNDSLLQGSFGALPNSTSSSNTRTSTSTSRPSVSDYIPSHRDPFELVPDDINNTKRQSAGERRRSEIIGQHRFEGVDGGTHCYFNLKVIFEPYRTGFEETKDFKYQKGTIVAGRYEVYDVLGTAAFSTALQCVDLAADTEQNENEW